MQEKASRSYIEGEEDVDSSELGVLILLRRKQMKMIISDTCFDMTISLKLIETRIDGRRQRRPWLHGKILTSCHQEVKSRKYK